MRQITRQAGSKTVFPDELAEAQTKDRQRSVNEADWVDRQAGSNHRKAGDQAKILTRNRQGSGNRQTGKMLVGNSQTEEYKLAN